MNEPRKIVLILGNGFDLDLGLKTSYKDFWESEFCPKNYPAPLIHHLNESWPNSLEKVKWYDLENELLNYYKRIPDPTIPSDFITKEELEFLSEFEPYKIGYGYYQDKLDLIESLLKKGVIRETNNFLCRYDVPLRDDIFQSPVWRDRKAFQLIKEGLCKYLQTLKPPLDHTKSVAAYVLLAISSAYKKEEVVNVYTFNYTIVPTIGRLIDDSFVHHMHGDCVSKRIIIGTRDDLNISSTYDFFQKSFDANYNPPALVEDLADADEVIIFGHSLGENDRQYFMPFFKQQASYGNTTRKNITIFTFDESSEVETKRALQRMTEGNLSALYGRNNLRIIKTGDLVPDQQDYRDFLMRFFQDEHYVKSVIGNLLSD